MQNRDSRNTQALNKPVPPYARLYFDHLYSEYITLKPSIKNESILSLLEGINEKRQQRDLTWSDIYTFDLALVDVRPPESLVRKAYDSRLRYRSVAGQKEYDEYVASKPLDLGTIQIDPDAQPPKPNVLIERELRADIKYLLSKFYLYYALLPVREAVRDNLTKKAVVLTAGVVVLIGLAIALNLGGSWVFPVVDQYSAVVVTVLTVTLSGVVGGCVSMLQRIQSAPSEGDALFNLAALTNGWRGILLSPLYGGIFASLLFVLFAGGILSGAVFPTIVTPQKGRQVAAATPTPSPAKPTPTTSLASLAPPSPSPVSTLTATETPNSQPTDSSIPATTPAAQSQVQKSGTPVSSPSPSPVPTSSPSPSPVPTSSVLQIKDFLRDTGPASGVSYSLLIIWSFLAGFAERLVPDTLNRLVQKNIDTQGGAG
jgi:hypothetical protein